MDAAKILDRVVAGFIGTKHERDIKKLQPVVAAINALEPEVKSLSDEKLRTRFVALRQEVQDRLKDSDPTDSGYRELLQSALESAIPMAFALAREAGRRVLNMRHFDVKLIGGLVLHDGKGAYSGSGARLHAPEQKPSGSPTPGQIAKVRDGF